MKLLLTTGLMASLALAGSAYADTKLPLKELPGIADRDYWVPGEVNADGKLEALQEVVGSEAVAVSASVADPVQIALIYPSADTSDFWARNYLALTKRLEQLGIPLRRQNSPAVRSSTRSSPLMRARSSRTRIFTTTSSLARRNWPFRRTISTSFPLTMGSAPTYGPSTRR